MIIAHIKLNDTALNYPKFLICGSFNPIHAGHIAIANFVHRKYGVPLDFEISLENVQKPTISLEEAKRRAQIMWKNKTPAFGKLWISDDARYLEKARYLPGVTFVCGFDTFDALCSGVYYKCGSLNDAIKEFKDLDIHWLVFPRKGEGKLGTKEDFNNFPSELMKNVTIVDPMEFEPMDISSRKIRG